MYTSWNRIGAVGLVALLVGLSSCGEAPTDTGNHPPAESLEGTWRWVSSMDVTTQELHTPQTAGFEAELSFAADADREGSFTYRRTGAPEVAGRFSIAFEDSPGNEFIALDQSIEFLESHAWIAAGPDSLWLGGVMEGGYNSRYVRVPSPGDP